MCKIESGLRPGLKPEEGRLSLAFTGKHPASRLNVERPSFKMWKERYNDSSMVLTALTTRTSAYLKKGDTISLTHIVHPARNGDEEGRYKRLL